MNYLILTIKYILVFFNFLCAVFGITIVVLSALLMKELGVNVETIFMCLIALGAIIFIIAFFGCCGALTENLCCLWMYAAILITLIAGNVTISIYIKELNNSKYARDNVNLAWQKMREDNHLTMHLYQSSMDCCGKTSFNDYPNEGMNIPISCYRDFTMTPAHLYTKGCIEVLTEMYKNEHRRLYNFTWVIFGIEAVCLVLAITLAVMYQLEMGELQ